jgi:hypothetical protein
MGPLVKEGLMGMNGCISRSCVLSTEGRKGENSTQTCDLIPLHRNDQSPGGSRDCSKALEMR